MDKQSCLRVIIDFVFDQQQPKPGHVFFLYRRHSMRLNNQCGVCATRFAGVGYTERSKAC